MPAALHGAAGPIRTLLGRCARVRACRRRELLVTHVVHGIGQTQRGADDLLAEWLPAISTGVRKAGHPDLADELWSQARPGTLNVRMAYYADLFMHPPRRVPPTSTTAKVTTSMRWSGSSTSQPTPATRATETTLARTLADLATAQLKDPAPDCGRTEDGSVVGG